MLCQLLVGVKGLQYAEKIMKINTTIMCTLGSKLTSDL